MVFQVDDHDKLSSFSVSVRATSSAGNVTAGRDPANLPIRRAHSVLRYSIRAAMLRGKGNMKKLCFAVAVAIVSALVSAFASAQYPARPIRLIVPYPPGGPVDNVGRIFAQQLSPGLGQPVVVENRPGAAGTIGAEAVAKSPADGYTLLLGTTGTLASAPSLYPNLGYDPAKSFAPISLLASGPYLVVVSSSLSANSLRDLIELAKSKPGQLNFGSAGTGNPLHIAGEMFKTTAGVDLVHVPYKGAVPALTDLMAGRIQIIIANIDVFTAAIATGKIRILAVAGPKRLAQLQNVPTAAEAGLPGFEVSNWFGLVAPRGTPNDAIARLNAEVSKALATRQVQDSLLNRGLEPGGGLPEQFQTLISAEGARWSRAVKASGAKLD
ncbi:MAG: tripartite tricarboxylate transporter substrate binding protein [Betaproteobacteria bacterium]|nr:tripartite tricarboxylate transporter substrate binding protein [Betaproteobacteria bacterium]